ncbi:MAG: amino acid permease [bacterium]
MKRSARAEPPIPAAGVLSRSLGTTDVVFLVVGMMVGSGVFVVPATTIRQTGGYAGTALLVWIVGGILSLLGALTYAELGAMKPQAGGLYVFIRDAFGPLPAFLYGWMLFFVMGSGILAALAVATTDYVSRLVPLGRVGMQLMPIVFIASLAAVNVIGTRRSARLTNMMTIAKVSVILVLAGACLSRGTMPQSASIWPQAVTPMVLSGFGAAMLGVLWSYEGWQWATFVVGETVSPQRVFPRGMVLGTLLGVTVYVLANAGYVATLGPEAMSRSTAVAADAARVRFGPAAGGVVAVLAILTIVGAANGLLLTVSRVFYAMANDGLFFRKLAEIHPRYGTPAASVVALAVVGMMLTVSGTFDQLLTYVVFTGWIFYALGGVSLFVFRHRDPEAARPFRVPGYPITPILFVLSAVAVVANTIVAQPGRAVVGLAVVAIGMPVYYAWRAWG